MPTATATSANTRWVPAVCRAARELAGEKSRVVGVAVVGEAVTTTSEAATATSDAATVPKGAN
eukprot:1190379-Prorocentrum_minimum.AAC.1